MRDCLEVSCRGMVCAVSGRISVSEPSQARQLNADRVIDGHSVSFGVMCPRDEYDMADQTEDIADPLELLLMPEEV